MFVISLKNFELLEMDFYFYSLNEKKMYEEECRTKYSCYKIFNNYKSILVLERYINNPSRQNLQRLLSNERISILTISKMIEDLKKIEKLIASKLKVKFYNQIKLITNTLVSYNVFLLRVEVILKALEEFRILNPIISYISFGQIISEMLLKDLI